MALEWLQGWINSRDSTAVCGRKNKKDNQNLFKAHTGTHSSSAWWHQQNLSVELESQIWRQDHLLAST